MIPDPLAAARPSIKTTQRTIILIPKEAHLMVDSRELGALLASARFVRVGEAGDIRPLPLQNLQTTTIPVEDSVLDAIDQANFQGVANGRTSPSN
jgi:hypothetical protein